MVIAGYNSSQNMIDNSQNLKVKTTPKNYPNLSIFYNEKMYRRQSGTFQSEEDLFSKNEERITKLYLHVMLLLKVLLTEPQVKRNNFNFEFQETFIKNGDDNQNVVEYEYENEETDLNKYDDFIVPNYYIGIKPCETILR